MLHTRLPKSRNFLNKVLLSLEIPSVTTARPFFYALDQLRQRNSRWIFSVNGHMIFANHPFQNPNFLNITNLEE